MAFNKIAVYSYYILQIISSRLTQCYFDLFLGVFDPTELIDGIRQMYMTREGWLSPFPWCEEFQFFVGDIFTRLKVVRRKKTRGEVTDKFITMSSLLHPHEECSKPRTVLIEGKPGMGKTTYCKKYVYDWATKKLNPQDCFSSIKAVLFLKCRDVKSDIWEAIDDQLLPEDIEEGVKQQFFQFIRANQSSILLILDGLDELPSSKVPMISKILEGKVLPKCYIVATARHEAGIKLRKCCDTLLEVEGFTKKHASAFIAKYFRGRSELAKKLTARISQDKILQEMCANPLNTALLCLLCEEFSGTLPENRTKLYLNMIECVLRRYRKKTELPDTEEDLTNLYKEELKTLGLIALNGLIEDKLDFEVNELGNHASDIAAFGFLSVHPGGSKLRPSLHYAFLHKSFQECLAAFYICCEIQDKRIIPEELVSDDRYFSNLKQVLLFSCGILAERSTEQATALVTNIGNQVEKERNTSVYPVKVLLEAINECKREKGDFHLQLAKRFGSNSQLSFICPGVDILGNELTVILCEAIKNSKTVTSLHLSGNGVNGSGATCIAEAIKVINTLFSLNLSNNGIDDIGATSIAEAIKVNKTVTNLDLSRNGISYIGATSIAEAMKVNETLTHLSLWGNDIGDAGATSIAEAIKVNKTVTNLDLSCNGISYIGATSIAEAMKVNETLTHLSLWSNDIGDAGATSIAEAINVNETLTSLDVSQSGFSAAGAAFVAKAIKVNKTLTSLDLWSNHFSDDGVASLADAIKVNKTLSKVNFAKNGIGDAGAASIAEAIKFNEALIDLDLSYNNIHYVGSTCISEAIKVNETLTSLDLSDNNFRDAGATSIAESIKVNKSLTSLKIWTNGIGYVGANSIAEAIKINKSLTSLSIWRNGIGDVGAKSIAEAIKVNKILTELDLSRNDISDIGTSSIAEAIKVEGTLTKLDLSYNDISDAGAAYIAEAIEVNETLISLNLTHSGVGDAGAISIAEAIKVNDTLSYFELSYNGISDTSATCIAEAVKVNKTLINLNLSGNGIGDVGATSFAEAIKVNKTLTSLNLSDNRISDAGAVSITEASKARKASHFFVICL